MARDRTISFRVSETGYALVKHIADENSVGLGAAFRAILTVASKRLAEVDAQIQNTKEQL